MAKKGITQFEYSEYEKLLKKYQKIRRNIIGVHKALQESVSNPHRLPQLVAPERMRKVRYGQFQISGRQFYLAKMRQMSKIVKGGYKEFYSGYKRNYLELYSVQ